MLRRHIMLITSFTVMGLIAGGVAWYLLRTYAPKYTAQTYIRVLSPGEKEVTQIRTQFVAKDIMYGHRLSLASLMKQQRTLEELLDRDKIKNTDWYKSFGPSKAIAIRKAFKDLQKHLGVFAQRDAEYILVSMTCGDKKEAALIVNEMVKMFLASQGTLKRGEVAEKLKQLNEQQLRLQRELNSAENSLQEVRDRFGIADLEVHNFQDTLTEKLNNLEIEQNEVVLEIERVRSTTENLQRQAEGPINKQVERQVESDSVMLTLAQQLAFLQAQLAAKLTKFGDNHRDIREIQELIGATQEERNIRQAVIAQQVRQSNLLNARDASYVLQTELERLEEMRAETEAKKRDLDLARVLYEQRLAIRDERETSLNRAKAAVESYRMLHDDPETPKVQFVGNAPEPLEMSSPKWTIYFPGATMLGFMLGIALTLMIELLNDLVRTPRDVARFLHIPLLGIIPDAAEDDLRGIDLALVARQAPYSVITEAYRTFRTNLKLSRPPDALKALLVTSGMAGDGKTSVAVNLATTLVSENKKVLLVDANFRRPSLQTLFPKSQTDGSPVEHNELGLSAILMGLCSYHEAARANVVEGLDIIEAGQLPSNPAELLAGPRMEQLIADQHNNYDHVIIDGPPLLLVSDTKVLAKIVDGSILVFNAAATRRGAAQRTIRELKQVNAAILGCVLLGVKAMKGGYFHEQFKSYQDYQKLQMLAHPA